LSTFFLDTVGANMDRDILIRKINLVIEMLQDGSIDSLNDRAALFSACQILMDQIQKFIESDEIFKVVTDKNHFNQSYVVDQVCTLRSYINYHLGFSDSNDVGPDDKANAINFAYKLKGLL
jgi:hypothetical protein